MDYVNSLITYMVPMDEKPRRYLCSPPPGVAEITWRSVQQPVSIYNGSASRNQLRLDMQGFLLGQHDTAVKNFHDENQIKANYYSEVERVVKDLTGHPRLSFSITMCAPRRRPNEAGRGCIHRLDLRMQITLYSPVRSAFVICFLPRKPRKGLSADSCSSTCGGRSKGRWRTTHWQCVALRASTSQTL